MSKKYSYVVSQRVVKNWSKLDSKTKNKTSKKIDLFLEDPFLPVLKTHQLKGKLKGYWSFSISHHLRLLFKFGKNKVVEFIDFGGHEIYK